MKYFLIEITYVKPLEVVEEHTPAHRAYLRTQYDGGILLFSGPRVPRTNGYLFARAADQSVIDAMIAADPFMTTGTADYKVIEIAPTLWAEQLKPVFE